MHSEFVILIADRNRHVREFLRRELKAEGYHIEVARDGREVLMIINGNEPPDLLILDLEIPYTDGPAILEKLQQRKPPMPLVIHTFLTDYANHSGLQEMTARFVEKSEDTDRLKTAVLEVLQRSYPGRFASVEEHIAQEN